MADSTLPKPVAPAPATAPIARTSRPLSESLLNDKWDRCISSLLIKSGLGLGFGVIFSVLLFKRRAWPAFVGFGFGAGRAVEECDNSFKSVAAQSRDGLRVLRP